MRRDGKLGPTSAAGRTVARAGMERPEADLHVRVRGEGRPRRVVLREQRRVGPTPAAPATRCLQETASPSPVQGPEPVLLPLQVAEQLRRLPGLPG